jgi:sulfur relay (sulfurtransferase) DsrF/TusC family protein
MARYLFIQSQDPFTEARTESQFDLMQRLQQAGNTVAVLLVQSGVSAARAGARSDAFDRLLASAIPVHADEFALQQREIAPAQLKPGVQAAPIDLAVDALLAGDKVIWN